MAQPLRLTGPRAGRPPMDVAARCRGCGLFLNVGPEDPFFGPPRIARLLPPDPQTCRLCGIFELLRVTLRQLDTRTEAVSQAFLVLEQLVLLLISVSGYSREVAQHRERERIARTDDPSDSESSSADEGAGIV